jgi:hypothetical protein
MASNLDHHKMIFSQEAGITGLNISLSLHEACCDQGRERSVMVNLVNLSGLRRPGLVKHTFGCICGEEDSP